MALIYRINVLQALKDKGYNTNRLRKEKILAESTIQKLRENKSISWANIAQICALLDCQPGDIMKYVDEQITDCGSIRTQILPTESGKEATPND